MAEGSKISEEQSKSFVDKVLNSIPPVAMGFFAIVLGLFMVLQATGYNQSANRVIEAYTKRIERSAASLESSAVVLEAVAKQVEGHEVRIKALEEGLVRTNKHAADMDVQFHRGGGGKVN